MSRMTADEAIREAACTGDNSQSEAQLRERRKRLDRVITARLMLGIPPYMASPDAHVALVLDRPKGR